MIRIIHIIVGLGSGGAENMLYKVLKYSDKDLYRHEVISLTGIGDIGPKIESLGIKVYALNFSAVNAMKLLTQMTKICKKADIINSWMYHSELIGFIIGKILLQKKVIWNVRHSNLDFDANKKRTLFIAKFNSLLSKKVDLITYNSNKALEVHLSYGYSSSNSIVIPNGFELDSFSFNKIDRRLKRSELSIKEDETILITVGRWNIQKDYYTLLKALSIINDNKNNFKLLMVGKNLDTENQELLDLISSNNMEDKVILLGVRQDVSKLLSAADIYISSSLGESFSNAIGEAMACELLCIVTDVGDSRMIVDEYGYVVPPKDPNLLSTVIHEVIGKKSKRLDNGKSREHIKSNYSIEKITKKFDECFKRVSER